MDSIDQGINIMESSMRHSLLSTFKSDNMIFNAIVSIIVISLISQLTQYLKFAQTRLGNLMTWIYVQIGDGFHRFLNRNKKPSEEIEKVITVESLTKDKTVNELYKAVYYYVTTTVDLIKESPVVFSYDRRIELNSQGELTNSKVNKLMNYGKEKKFKYNGKEIKYKIDTQIIQVHTDKSRDRELHVITLKTKINKKDSVDFFDEFSQYCMKEYAKSLTNKPWVQQLYTNKGNKWVGTDSKNRRKMETVVLRGSMSQEITEKFDLFLKSEQFYVDRDIKYSWGVLLDGPPGVGKTSIVKALSLRQPEGGKKRHIHYLSLSAVSSDAELGELLNAIDYDSTILLIEDIDASSDVVKEREPKPNLDSKKEEVPDSGTVVTNNSQQPVIINMYQPEPKSIKPNAKQFNPINGEPTNANEKGSGVTLSGLLNHIDGIGDSHGRIMFWTTNHADHLDSALTRPGRIDKIFKFKNADRDQIRRLYRNFFDVDPDPSLVDQIEDERYSPADVVGRFINHRLEPTKALLEMLEPRSEKDK